MYLAIASALAVTLAVASCPNPDERTATTAPSPPSTRADTMTALQPLTRLLTQQTSGYRLGDQRIIRDQTAWAGAWQTIQGGLPGGDPSPTVDFARDMVVLVALGEANSGGITVHVDDVSRDGAALVVHYTVTEPGEGCMTTQALTAPIDVVRVPRAAGEVRFERRTVKAPC